MERRRASLQENPLGLQPEQALVLETVGSIDNFVNAIRNIEGLEWLGEFELEDIEPNYGFEDYSDSSKGLKGQLFLVMTDQRALQQMKSLFDNWQKNPNAPIPRKLAAWKRAFVHLQEIRPWGARDRIRETGLLEDWRFRLLHDQKTVPFEAELWFRNSPDRRWQAEAELRRIVEGFDGEIVQQCVIPDISYHAVLGRLSCKHIQEIAEQPETYLDIELLHCAGIMHVRPVGQCAVHLPQGILDTQSIKDAPSDRPTGNPILALLDGLPLTGHHKLTGRLIVDDPDGFESVYQAHERVHGTEMASMICLGDLEENDVAAKRPLYVRPIMQPQYSLDGTFTKEAISEYVLPVDLVHRAIRRLYEPVGDEPPAAPSVRIINLSICDQDRPLDRRMSSMARLLDWLAWKYNALFIVSAGNHTGDLRLATTRDSFLDLENGKRTETIIKAIAKDTRNRRLLCPAETVNGLTVGGVHEDISKSDPRPGLIDPFPPLPPKTLLPTDKAKVPGLYSAHGPGYRRAIKPDLLLSGGRQFLSEKMGNDGDDFILSADTRIRPPGHCVATPGLSGTLNQTRHTRGTSIATALASRSASLLFEILVQLRDELDDSPPTEYDAVLIKALLVHGAEWADAYELYERVLKNSNNGRQFKEYVGRFLGYGAANIPKVMECTDQRVTVLGFGELGDGGAHEYRLPLPPSLSAKAEMRRLAITLAWLTPVSSTSRRYRNAHLWFDPNQQNAIAQQRQDANHLAVQRGTVQHEILKGNEAVPFQDGDTIQINVNCRADAGDITDPIRYGLAVTLEVAEEARIPIYEEIRDRLAVGVPVQVTSSR